MHDQYNYLTITGMFHKHGVIWLSLDISLLLDESGENENCGHVANVIPWLIIS